MCQQLSEQPHRRGFVAAFLHHYGGGEIEIGRAAVEAGAEALAVGAAADAVDLRRHGLRCPILLYAEVGSEAVLLGRQGDKEISGLELSQALNIPILELLPRLARCGPQRYVGASADA